MTFRSGHIFTAKICVLFALLLGVILQIGQILGHIEFGKLDLTGQQAQSLTSETRDLFNQFDGRIAFTYFVTEENQMPAHLKGVVKPVTNLLNNLQAVSPEQFSFRILDPDVTGETGQAYAARKRVSPFSVPYIHKDEHSERDVWSSLVIAPEGHKEILIQKITPDDLPYLQDLILENLSALSSPPTPQIALIAPNFVTLFTQFAKQYGQVDLVSLNSAKDFPHNADILFWLEPQNVNQQHIQELQKFIQNRKTVVLAGSTYLIDYHLNASNQITYRAYPTGNDFQNLLAPFGIVPQPDLLMDESQGPIFFRDHNQKIQQVDAPFHLRVMPGFYNMKGFLSPARGALNFVGASPLEIDPRKVQDAGFQVDILGTTTEKSAVQTIPQGDFVNSDLSTKLQIGKQNIMLRLSPKSPWVGDVVVLGSSSPFRDGIINQPNFGHRVFLQTMLRSFTERSRIVKGRVNRPAPPEIPQLSNSARLTWRILCVFLIPGFLLVLGARRYFDFRGVKVGSRISGHVAIKVGLGILVLGLVSRFWARHTGMQFDLTEQSVHTPRPFTEQKFSTEQIKVDVVMPPRAQLPAKFKQIETRTISLLSKLGIEWNIRRPGNLTEQDKDRLVSLGIKPFEVRSVYDDQEISQWVWSGLVLHKPGGSAIIPRLDERTIEHLEFHLLTAEYRLNQGTSPHIAIISEPPRLSPAEAFEYQQKQLTPPKGADVFSEVQGLLRTYGYRVTYINPSSAELPEDTDLVIWMQPRRDASKTTEAFSHFLANGGNGFVALQHFNIQQRQYRGAGFQTVYWPQPQYQDLNAYLDPLGLNQVREVLMDQTKSRLSLETQINRTGVREFEAQEVALPFLIRAIGPNYEQENPITKDLGDQLFIWGNRFAIQPDSLKQFGLKAKSLISTTDQAWAYDWQGGWLPPNAFEPTDSMKIGSQPLLVLTQGTFPQIDFVPNESGQTSTRLSFVRSPREGKLMLVGSSEMFKNDYIYAPGFQHEQLLLNAASYLTYEQEYAEIQARRKKSIGFPHQPSHIKAFWRIFVVCAGATAFLLFGILRYITQPRLSVSKK